MVDKNGQKWTLAANSTEYASTNLVYSEENVFNKMCQV